MEPKSNEIDPLIKSFGISSSISWKKRSVILITIILIFFVIYLIICNLAPSLKLDDKNDINNNINNENLKKDIFGIDPFINWNECNLIESPPQIIGYHIHALFDGNDINSISFAYKLYHNFIDLINPSMNECTFSHSTPSLIQNEICYFPTTSKETDFPQPSNFIFSTANYAFYIPPFYLSETIKFWIKYHNDINYVIHTVSGCQLNDHSKWLIKNYYYNDNLVSDNLLCCHNGPAMCSCNIVQYEMDNNKCLGIDINHQYFIYTQCEDVGNRNIGSWRELIYNEKNNWYQIENYGNIDHPIYLCLGILNNNDEICNIGTEIKLIDCSYHQDINNNIWISKTTQFKYDINTNQIKLLSCNQNNNLCINVNQQQNNDVLKLTINQCQQSTVFKKRHFFP